MNIMAESTTTEIEGERICRTSSVSPCTTKLKGQKVGIYFFSFEWIFDIIRISKGVCVKFSRLYQNYALMLCLRPTTCSVCRTLYA